MTRSLLNKDRKKALAEKQMKILFKTPYLENVSQLKMRKHPRTDLYT